MKNHFATLAALLALAAAPAASAQGYGGDAPGRGQQIMTYIATGEAFGNNQIDACANAKESARSNGMGQSLNMGGEGLPWVVSYTACSCVESARLDFGTQWRCMVDATMALNRRS